MDLMADAPNPFIDDEDDDTYEPFGSPSTESLTPEPNPAATNPYAIERTPEAQAEVDRLKAEGEVPDGKKKNFSNPVYRRRRITGRDLDVLVPLAKWQYGTADLLRPLQIKEDKANPRATEFVRADSVGYRLRGLEEAGLTRSHVVTGVGTLWGLTRKGHSVADLSYHFREGEAHKLANFNPTGVPHRLGVLQIAMQAMSPKAFSWQRVARVPNLGYDEVLSEHEIMHHWQVRKNEIDDDNKGRPKDIPAINFGYWREHRLMSDIYHEAQESDFDWSDVALWHPELWTIGQKDLSFDKDDVRNHHHPDLIFNLESRRKGRKPVSVAVEVELNAKTPGTYRKHLSTWWACEFDDGSRVDADGTELYSERPRWDRAATVYSKVIYFTNTREVVQNLRKADKEFGFEEAGKLIILPLLENDDKTRMGITRGWRR